MRWDMARSAIEHAGLPSTCQGRVPPIRDNVGAAASDFRVRAAAAAESAQGQRAGM